MDSDELRDQNRAREHQMLAQAKDEILHCGDFLPVSRLAQHLNTRVETLSPALFEWEAERRMFSIEHEGCSLFPCYVFSTHLGIRPHPEMKEILSVLTPTKDGWLMAFWFASSNGILGGKRPRDLICADATRVTVAAQHEADGILHG